MLLNIFLKFRNHWLPLFFLLLPALLYHWRIWLLGEIIQGGDFINQFVPWREFALSELAAGRLPFWNPYVFSGSPFAANIQTSLFYPFNGLNLLFSVEYAFSLSLACHHLAALGFMYYFLHRLGVHRVGALIGAMVYGWSGFLITHGHDGHLIHVRAYAWLPLALHCQTLLLHGGRFGPIFGLALTLAAMFFGGHTQIPLYGFYLLLARAAWHCWPLIKRRDWRGSAALIFSTLGGIFFSLLLSLLVLLPLYHLAQHTAGRAGGADYAFATSDSMPPAFLITFITPFFYGDPTAEARESQYWLSSTGYHELSGYTGVTALALALLAFLPNRRRTSPGRLAWDTGFFALLAAGGLFFALGHYNPFYPLLYYGLPGWSYFRVPGRLVLYFIVGIAVCSARGWQLWQEAKPEERQPAKMLKLAAALSLLLAFLVPILWFSKEALIELLREIEVNRTIAADPRWAEVPRYQITQRLPDALFQIRFSWMLHSTLLAALWLGILWLALWFCARFKNAWAGYLPAAVVLIDLFYFSSNFIPTMPAQTWQNTYFPQSELVQFLQEHAAHSRVLCLDDAIGHPGLQYHPELRPNRLMHYGIKTVRGYDPIILQEYTAFVNRLFGRPQDAAQGGLLFFSTVPESELFQYLNVGYIVTTQSLPEVFKLVYEEEGSPIKVYENPKKLGRFFWPEHPSADVSIEELTPQSAAIHTENSPSQGESATLVWAQNRYLWQAEVNGEHTRLSEWPKAPWTAVEVDNTQEAKIVFTSQNGRLFLLGGCGSAAGLVLGCIGMYYERRKRSQ